MTVKGSHPRLKRPLVQEAVFEIRFETRASWGVLPGRVFEQVKEKFPETEDLPASHLPPEVGPLHLPRHRFLSARRGRMIQLGVGMVSTNHLSYEDYAAFLSDSLHMIEVAYSLGLLTEIGRLGLRYVNSADLDRPWSEILSIRVEAPPEWESEDSVRNFRWVSPADQVGKLTAITSWPVEGDNTRRVVFDLDCFLENPGALDKASLEEWHREAHERVYQAFVSGLMPKYFSSLREEGE